VRVAITGSTGLIGAALARDLRGSGAELIRLVRRDPAGDEELRFDPAAADAGLSPAALYNHFDSKDELLFVLVRYRHLRLERDVANAQLCVDGDPVAELRAIVAIYIRTHVDQRSSAEVANHEYRHLPDHHRREVTAIRRRLRNRVVDVLDRGTRNGAFHPVGPGGRSALVITAGVILEMCIGASQWVHRDGPLDVEELTRSFTDIALRAAGYCSC